MADASIPQKQCSCCGEFYPIAKQYFPIRSNGKLRADCRVCARKRTQKWREEHPNSAADWADAHPDYQKQWYQDNKEEHLARTKKRYYSDPQAKLKKNQEWREKNPDKTKIHSRVHQHRRRKWKRESKENHTPKDIEILLRSQKGLCWWCGKPHSDNYEIDHRIALSRGGSNGANNLVISCKRCNRNKRAKMPHEWNGRLL